MFDGRYLQEELTQQGTMPRCKAWSSAWRTTGIYSRADHFAAEVFQHIGEDCEDGGIVIHHKN
jgi:hypothetical protein